MTVHWNQLLVTGKCCEALYMEHLPDKYSTVYFAKNIELRVWLKEILCVYVCV